MSLSIEQRLSYLGFLRLSPSPVLQPYVRCFWVMRREIPLATQAQEFMHANGGFGIGFNLGGDLTLDGQPLRDPVFLDGTNTYSRKMGFTGSVEAIGFTFKPGGAYPFLAIPLAELANATNLLDAVGNRVPLLLHEQISEADSLSSKIALLESWLISRLKKDASPLVTHSLKLIRDRAGQIAVSQLADDLHISQRQLERLYHTHVGMTPKHYARLQRIDRARDALKRLRGQSVAQVSAALDFYDQAHFTHEFKAVVGMTPRRYMQEKAESSSPPQSNSAL